MGKKMKLRLVWIAGKGDWPYLRKVSGREGSYGVWWIRISQLGLTRGGVPFWNLDVLKMGLSMHASKAFALQTGFTSARVCHLCTGQDSLIPLVSWNLASILVFLPMGPKQPPPGFDWTKSLHIAAALQEWHRFDAGSPWMAAGARPGPSPFKSEGSVFDIVPGADLPSRIYPDLVHTFHIGYGCDLTASIICWLARLNIFGNGKFDEKLRKAYSDFQAFCHDTNRFTACDEWSTKKLGMTQILV